MGKNLRELLERKLIKILKMNASDCNSSAPNWLGFSLSPNLKTEDHYQFNHQKQASSSVATTHNVPASLYISSSSAASCNGKINYCFCCLILRVS